jgi:DNA-binding transcriptional LysR family regulator
MRTLKKGRSRASSKALPFDLRALEVFLAITETKGFTTAARQLGLTQPAVSQVLAQLEAIFGVKLVDRSVKPLALTVAGTVLRDGARSLLEEARSILPMVKESAAAKLPIVRIGIVDSLFAPLASILGVKFRGSVDQLSISSGFTEAHRARLLSRDIDIAIGADAIEDVDELERFVLVEEPFILLLPAGRRDRGRSDLMQLSKELPFVRYGERSHMGRLIELYLRRLGLRVPRTQAYDSSNGVIRMVAAGVGWSIVTPLCVLDGQSLMGQAICAPLPPPGLSRQLTLVCRRRELGHLPERIATLTRQVLQTQCASDIHQLMPWIGDQFFVPPPKSGYRLP